jgi:hypothetical protein
MGYVVKPIKGEVDEGWKSKLAGAALAGAAAFGGGGAQANDQIAKDTQGIGQAFRSGQMAPKQYAPGEISLSQIHSHPKWLETVQAMIKKYPKNHEDDQRAQTAAREAIKQMIQQGNVREGSAEQVDEIDMGLVGDAVAGAAMGLGSVGLGSYIGHKIGNKIGQKFIDRSNRKDKRKEAEAGSEKMKAIEKARADRIAANKAYRDHENLYGYELEQDHPEYQNRVNLGNKKFRNMDVPSAFDEEQQVYEKSEAVRHGNNSRSIYHVDESVDPIEQLRADIRRFSQ